MPRRGEYTPVPVPPAPAPALAQIGIRRVTGHGTAAQVSRVLELDPGTFRCARLVAQLADEWVAHATLARSTSSVVGSYRRAVVSFADYVDRHDDDPAAACLT